MVAVLHKVMVTFVSDKERRIVCCMTNRTVGGGAVMAICFVAGMEMVIFDGRVKATLNEKMIRISFGVADVYFFGPADPHPRSASACGYGAALAHDLGGSDVCDACVPWSSLQYPLQQLLGAASA